MKALEKRIGVDTPVQSTLLDSLVRDVARKPDENMFTFVLNDGVTDETISYFEFEQLVTRIARSLSTFTKPGADQIKAILLLPPGKEFVSTFYACFTAGVIAVPSFPIQNDLKLERLKLIISDLGDPIVIGNEETLKSVAPYLRENDCSTRCVLYSDLVTESPGQFLDFIVDPDSIALLQYTSGSTGSPKGVIISNRNLVENSIVLKESMGNREGYTRSVFWLPPYHDMGLVAGILQGTYSSFPVMLMPTSVFLRNQFRWLEGITRFRATNSGAPNFAFELCVRNVKERKLPDLDLSSWDVAFCGAEPINHQTMLDFTKKFAPVGFKPSAIYPCYGMAEATLMVSGMPLQTTFKSLQLNSEALSRNRIETVNNESTGKTQHLVSCGRVHDSLECRIVDPALEVPMSEGEIGEIWISGSSIAQGYWKKPDETAKSFGKRIFGSDGRFYRTGDLGFLREGELYMTGRIKEVVIIRGANYYPQDIEAAAKAVCGKFKNCRMAAFSSDIETGEPLILGVEVPRGTQEFESVALDIEESIISQFGVKPDRILFLPRRTVRITSSGKLQRLALKKAYISNELQVYFSWPKLGEDEHASENGDLQFDTTSADKITTWIRYAVAQKVNASPDRILPDDQFSRIGLDSVTAMDILSVLEDSEGIRMEPEILYQHNTPKDLAEEIFRQLNR